MLDFTGQGNVASYCTGIQGGARHNRRAMSIGQDRAGQLVWKCSRCKTRRRAYVSREGTTWVLISGQDVLVEKSGVRLAIRAVVYQTGNGRWVATDWSSRTVILEGRDRDIVRVQARVKQHHEDILRRTLAI